MWEIEYYSEKVLEEILALPESLQARYAQYAKRMKDHGANLGMPHTRPMGAGLFELRLQGKEGIGRVFYCTLIGQRIVRACKSTTLRFPIADFDAKTQRRNGN